jgi:hypothetical protein
MGGEDELQILLASFPSRYPRRVGALDWGWDPEEVEEALCRRFGLYFGRS